MLYNSIDCVLLCINMEEDNELKSQSEGIEGQDHESKSVCWSLRENYTESIRS